MVLAANDLICENRAFLTETDQAQALR